jgi:hypothetical protein
VKRWREVEMRVIKSLQKMIQVGRILGLKVPIVFLSKSKQLFTVEVQISVRC